MLRINIITYSKLKTLCLENPENIERRPPILQSTKHQDSEI